MVILNPKLDMGWCSTKSVQVDLKFRDLEDI
jgi:hypothetical protein